AGSGRPVPPFYFWGKAFSREGAKLAKNFGVTSGNFNFNFNFGDSPLWYEVRYFGLVFSDFRKSPQNPHGATHRVSLSQGFCLCLQFLTSYHSGLSPKFEVEVP